MSTLALPLASPWYEGAATPSTVPGVYDCAVAGMPLMIDWKFADEMRLRSIPLLKPQSDQSGNVGEQSLNPEDFPRRSQESWHHGAGQAFLDAGEFDPFRFRTSKGVDVWTKKQFTLLPDTASRLASANTNLAVVPVGSYLYVSDGAALKRTQDITVGSPTWTTVTGTPAGNVGSIATDGFNVWTQHAGANGIYATTRGGAATAAYVTAAVSGPIGFVKGRLMAWDTATASLYNIVAGGALPTALLTVANTDFVAVGFAEGPSNIYMAGYSGDKSLIYRTTIKTDGTGLDAPVVAGELPDGEIVRSIAGYLGFLLVGTDRGMRLAALDDAGNVATMSDLIPTGAAVRCFEPQDRFVWYGLTNYDAQSTGLGRADLSVFTKGLNPAYTSDLMAAGQGAVLSAATFQNLRVFAVSGLGIYAQTATLVASGSIDGGHVTFGLPDTKVAVWLDVRHEALDGTVTVAISADGGPFLSVGASTSAGSTAGVVALGNQRGQTHEVRLAVGRGSTTTGPTVHRWTLEANPAPGRGEMILLPLLLFEKVNSARGDEIALDVAATYRSLLSFETLGAPLPLTTGLGTETVFLDDHEFAPHSYTGTRDAFNGTFLAHFRRPRSRP